MAESERCTMLLWLHVALLIAIPCFGALLVYDALTVFLLRHDEYRLHPGVDFAHGLLQDLGLAGIYAAIVTPRILPVLPPSESRPTTLSVIMLGLGLAWYDVLSAFISRMLPEPPGFAVSLVVLFVIPVLLAPWYLGWLLRKAHGS